MLNKMTAYLKDVTMKITKEITTTPTITTNTRTISRTTKTTKTSKRLQVLAVVLMEDMKITWVNISTQVYQSSNDKNNSN